MQVQYQDSLAADESKQVSKNLAEAFEHIQYLVEDLDHANGTYYQIHGFSSVGEGVNPFQGVHHALNLIHLACNLSTEFVLKVSLF